MIEIIYHIADVHITANLERQDEYNKVLEKAINVIKNDKREKLVVIVGDLFHEKTKVYQEANVMARNFLKKLGDVCEIVIVAGNHDCCIDNESRTDSIEATLCNLVTNEKINYLTENIIDEGLSAADKVNVNKFANLMEMIKKEYEICILISHIDEIKNQKGRVLEIEYDENTMESHIEIKD